MKDNGEGAKSAPDQASNNFAVIRNYRDVYSSLENFLANINCTSTPTFIQIS
jgi:hypothetical protein